MREAQATLTPREKALRQAYQDVGGRLDDLLLILYKIDWAKKEIKDEGLYRAFVALDIQHFHVALRTTLDHLARFITNLAPGPIREIDSFSGLYGSTIDPAKNARFKAALGPHLFNLVVRQTWFDAFTEIRNHIVHRTSMTLVFPDRSKGVLFQIYMAGLNPAVRWPHLMFNKNIGHFEPYAALMTAKLLRAVGSACEIAKRQLGSNPQWKNSTKWYSMGHGVFLNWLSQYQ
ncbi:MAG: hypothetical protein HY079_10305 [Elusimicrobia bacterium]|nr:hypothetical protein [Elusimicrobiota bacterium]